ncbi:hypothetical protein DVT68_11450 [Dyella solisilvae]|uniref:Periplasmic heavy metal sensor n=1 Tax=Dyella solisilvae TaxID=1920168 RepID=A0A370K8W9_9GAMM|nr:hypothetical protein [Dyella solisilvae]RDI99088.1 hypothetical protein DVT68_11450 [Dyella solisilvae]
MTRLPRIAMLVLGLALAGSALAQSQGNTPPPPEGNAAGQPPQRGGRMPDPQQQLERMSKQLQLTSDQQAKLAPILQQRAQQMQALRGDNSLSPADRRAKMMALMQQSQSQIDAILTPAQRDQMKAMREKAQERMEERRSQRAPSSTGGG